MKKHRTWVKKKNVNNDGVRDAKFVITAPRKNKQTYQKPQNNNQNNMQANAVSQQTRNQMVNNMNNQGEPQS